MRVAERGRTSYFHLMPERHEVIHAEGAGRERFHPNDPGMAAIPPPPSQPPHELRQLCGIHALKPPHAFPNKATAGA